MNEQKSMPSLKYKMPDTVYKKLGMTYMHEQPNVGEIAYEPATGGVFVFNGTAFTRIAPVEAPALAPAPAAPVPPSAPRRLILD